MLRQQSVARERRPYYYWDFCHKYGFEPKERQSFPPFDEKLRAKDQSDFQRRQAQHAVSLYYVLVLTDQDGGQRVGKREPVNDSKSTRVDGAVSIASRAGAETPAPPIRPVIARPPGSRTDATPVRSLQPQAALPSAPSPPARKPVGLPSTPLEPPAQPLGLAIPREAVGSKLSGASWVSVYDRVQSAIKIRHYSPKTLKVYKAWTQKFQAFTQSKDPQRVSMNDVKGFLSFLAVEKKVAASSQNQAFNALLFLFKHVLEKEFGKVEGVVRAKRTKYIPVVLSRAEVDRVVRFLEDPYDLVVKLLYDCGLRLFECLKLRVQDLNFEMKVLTVHDGKGRIARCLYPRCSYRR